MYGVLLMSTLTRVPVFAGWSWLGGGRSRAPPASQPLHAQTLALKHSHASHTTSVALPGERFTTQHTHTPHSLSAVGQSLVFCCDRCEATFTSRAGLSMHVRQVHLHSHPYRCGVCGKGFFIKQLFKDHINKHSNIKAHRCGRCGRQFTYKGSLLQHLRNRVCGNPKALG